MDMDEERLLRLAAEGRRAAEAQMRKQAERKAAGVPSPCGVAEEESGGEPEATAQDGEPAILDAAEEARLWALAQEGMREAEAETSLLSEAERRWAGTIQRASVGEILGPPAVPSAPGPLIERPEEQGQGRIETPEDRPQEAQLHGGRRDQETATRPARPRRATETATGADLADMFDEIASKSVAPHTQQQEGQLQESLDQTQEKKRREQEKQDQLEAEYGVLVERLREKGLTEEADAFQTLLPRLRDMAPARFVRPIPPAMLTQGYWKNMNPNERSVYLELLRELLRAADGDTGSSFLKRTTLAECAKVGMSTLKRCIHALTRKGLLFSYELRDTSGRRPKWLTHRRLQNAAWTWKQEPVPAGWREPGGTRARKHKAAKREI